MIDYENKTISAVWCIEDVDEIIDGIREDDGMVFVPLLSEDEKFQVLKNLDTLFENGYSPETGDIRYELKLLYEGRMRKIEVA